jgi:hypothetical protein
MPGFAGHANPCGLLLWRAPHASTTHFSHVPGDRRRHRRCGGAGRAGNVGGEGSLLNSIQVLPPTDAWIVGATFGLNGATRTLTEQFNGTTWTIAPSPDPGHLGGMPRELPPVGSQRRRQQPVCCRATRDHEPVLQPHPGHRHHPGISPPPAAFLDAGLRTVSGLVARVSGKVDVPGQKADVSGQAEATCGRSEGTMQLVRIAQVSRGQLRAAVSCRTWSMAAMMIRAEPSMARATGLAGLRS